MCAVDSATFAWRFLFGLKKACITFFIYSKPVLSGHSKIDITKVFGTNGSSMKVEHIAEQNVLPFEWPLNFLQDIGEQITTNIHINILLT